MSKIIIITAVHYLYFSIIKLNQCSFSIQMNKFFDQIRFKCVTIINIFPFFKLESNDIRSLLGDRLFRHKFVLFLFSSDLT
jgi:hypothetical protein